MALGFRQTTEADVEKGFVDWCEKHGLLALKLMVDGERGFPDRTVIAPSGQIAFIELKRPKGGKYSPNQERWRAELWRRSCSCGRAKTLDEAVAWARKVFNIQW